MYKNVSGQYFFVFAFNKTTNSPVEGDAANITATISKDAGSEAATDDTNPTELSGGLYYFTATQDETNADAIVVIPESSTANVQVISVPGVIYTNELDDIKTKTDLISTGIISVISPVLRSGALQIVRGDDYNNSDSRAIDFTNTDGDWPDLTGATVVFTAKNAKTDNTDFSASMSVVTPTGANQKVRLELTDVQTNTLKIGKHSYDVQVTLASSRVVTLQRMVQGFEVLEDYT